MTVASTHQPLVAMHRSTWEGNAENLFERFPTGTVWSPAIHGTGSNSHRVIMFEWGCGIVAENTQDLLLAANWSFPESEQSMTVLFDDGETLTLTGQKFGGARSTAHHTLLKFTSGIETFVRQACTGTKMTVTIPIDDVDTDFTVALTGTDHLFGEAMNVCGL